MNIVKRTSDRLKARKRVKQRQALLRLAQSFVYTPLDENAKEIRLLTIIPGDITADIRVRLDTTPLGTNHVLEYEALSYTWGSPDNPVEIWMGDSGLYTLSVTRNLAEALLYLRYKDKPRILWIDAICVNQQDLQERSSQVKRMADLYSQAAKVVVWIGPESLQDNSRLAIDTIAEMSSEIAVDYSNHRLTALSTERQWIDPEAMPLEDGEIVAICKLLDRDWFHRLWTWQEVSRAQHAVVQCGSQTVPWSAIRKVVFCLYSIRQPQVGVDNMPESHRDHLYNLCSEHSELLFPSLLDWTKYSLCTDPRDRIFALLSLTDNDKAEIQPDYSKPASKVYEDFVVQSIQTLHHLKLLTMVGPTRVLEGLPSWVPDWSYPKHTMRIEGTIEMSGPSRCSVQHHQLGTLLVTGLLVGIVEHVVPLDVAANHPFSEVKAQIQKSIQSVWALLNSYDHTLNYGSPVFHALVRTLSMNEFADLYQPVLTSFQTKQQMSEVIQKLLSYTSEEFDAIDDNETLDSFIRVLDSCRGRNMFRTFDNRIGLAPEATQVGDVIALWLGCRVGMILRPISASSGIYQVIGEAYCDGLMSGEALLGPLPENIELIQYNDGTNTFVNAFINRKTGEINMEDPRFGEVPTGWKKTEHDMASTENVFVCVETGEIFPQSFDPRLEPDVLRARGIDLQVFELV